MASLANSSVFPEEQRTPEEKLWKAVLSQGVYEACTKRHQALPLTYAEMKSTINWIDLSNKDFLMVCSLAGYDPNYVYRKALKKVNNWVPNGA